MKLKKGGKWGLAAVGVCACCVVGVFCAARFAARDKGGERATIPVVTQSQGTVAQSEKSTASLPEQTEGTKRAAPASVDDRAFEGTVFLGNSCIEDVQHYGIVKTADFYTKVGLTVHSALTLTDKKTGLPALDAISKKDYKKVVLVFGVNELDWNAGAFTGDYEKLIARVKKSQPGAKLYIHAVLPVSREVDARSEDSVNMNMVRSMNERLKEIAKKVGATYLDPSSALVDGDGFLLPDAAPDGIHPNYYYCKIWMQNLAGKIK